MTTKGGRTRDRIVAAAAGLMADRGVAGTTTEDVRAAAGVSSSQIYHYFADKGTLVRAVIARQADAVIGHHERLLADVDGLAGLRAWRDFIVDRKRAVGGRGGCPIGSLGSELADADPRARADLAAGFDRWRDGIRDGLRRMRAGGRLRADARPDDLALAMLAALQGGLLLAQVQRDTRPLEVALDAMISLVASWAPPVPTGRRPRGGGPRPA